MITTQENKSQTIKMWKSTLKKLRFIRAYTGEQMVVILDRLVRVELETHEREGTNEDHQIMV